MLSMKIETENTTKMMKATDAILENLLDAVLVVDNAGYIIYANRSAQELFSRKTSELVGQPFGFPIVPHEVQEIEVFKEGKVLTAQMLASHISWDGQTASLLSLRDITAQRQVQEELARQRKLLEKTNEENAQYASLASHDLKEPIRKILVFSDMLLKQKALTDTARLHLSKIQSAAKRMHALIGGIAELSKITHMRQVFVPVNLKAVIEEVVNDLELQIDEKNAVVDVSELPTIDAIQNEMYQLFLNLISNSLKYSKEDVTPHIRIRQLDSEDGFVSIECSDNGIGFNSEAGAKLFQPFQRLHTTKYDGMGIGLTLCQKIVDAHHGRISAEGKDGQGATFRIVLPKYQANELHAMNF